MMTRPSTAAAATNTTPPQPQINPPLNDAAMFKAPVTITYQFNGQTQTQTITPDPTEVAYDLQHAHSLALIGHGEGKEGSIWSAKAVANGASQAQIQQLRSDGYAV